MQTTLDVCAAITRRDCYGMGLVAGAAASDVYTSAWLFFEAAKKLLGKVVCYSAFPRIFTKAL